MRAFELIAALVVGAVLLVALKLIGMMIQVAVIGGLIGIVAGYLLARSLRSRA